MSLNDDNVIGDKINVLNHSRELDIGRGTDRVTKIPAVKHLTDIRYLILFTIAKILTLLQ